MIKHQVFKFRSLSSAIEKDGEGIGIENGKPYASDKVA